MVLVFHLHQDHFDAGAKKMLPKEIPLFCQPGHEEAIREEGFLCVTPIDRSVTWEGIEITRTPGRHANNQKWEDILGKVSGFVLKAANEPLAAAGGSISPRCHLSGLTVNSGFVNPPILFQAGPPENPFLPR